MHRFAHILMLTCVSRDHTVSIVMRKDGRAQTSVAIDEDVYKRLQAIAGGQRRSIKQQIAVMVEEYERAHPNGVGVILEIEAR